MQYPVTTRAFGLPILVLSGLNLMVVLDGTVVIFAIPRLQEQMGLSSVAGAWTVTAYGLPFAGLMLLGGRLGDAFGRKRMLIVGISLFTAGSALCGLAQADWMLLTARAIQGTGSAVAAPAAMALVASTFAPGPARNQAIAMFGSMMAVGSVGGLVVGGALTQVSWRWIFLINVPVGLLLVGGATYRLRDTTRRRVPLDIRGAVLGTLGCVGIVFGATEGPEMGWTSLYILGPIVAGLALLLVFVLAERSADDPLLPWSLFDRRDRVLTFIACILVGGVMGAMTFFVAQFLQNVLGYTPLTAGLAAIPFTIGVGIGGAASSKAALSIRPRWLLGSSALLLAGGLFYSSTLDSAISYFPTLLILLPLIGFAVGIIMVVVPLCLLVDVPSGSIGPLTAIGQMAFNLGGPVAIGLLSPLALSRTLARGGTEGKPAAPGSTQIDALTSGYTLVLGICGIAAVVIGLVVLALRYTPQELAQAQHAQEEAQQQAQPHAAAPHS